jgi:thermostable 8-oxoguanine DNA glycosylase
MTQHTNQIVQALLRKYGYTFSEELGIKLESNTPSALFRWLCATLLFSAPIGNKAACSAAKALFHHHWTTAQKMLKSTWKERTRVLNRSGYARFDEKTSRRLAEIARFLLNRYQGDLRKLRLAAKYNPRRERNLIMECKGIGEVGASIFFREIQTVWKEHVPFVDQFALTAARKLGLPTEAQALKQLVPSKKFPQLLAALVRCNLAKDFSGVLASR